MTNARKKLESDVFLAGICSLFPVSVSAVEEAPEPLVPQTPGHELLLIKLAVIVLVEHPEYGLGSLVGRVLKRDTRVTPGM